jgi:hypothetical protein
MKKLFTLLLLVLFFSVHGLGLGDFNIFLQRKIIVGPLENLGEQEDNYLIENLSEQLRLLIIKAPFISLTDRERAFLLTLSLGDEYRETFEQTDGKINYRLEPVTVLGDLDLEDYPLYISGNYALHTGQEPDSEVELKLQIDVYNTMTDTAREPVFIEGNLSDFIDDPQDFLYPFLSEFLLYTIYRMNLTAEPPDALISVDDQLVGIGTVINVLVTPGLHRITVRRDGYREYRDLVQVPEDGYWKHVALQPETRTVLYDIATTPEGAKVYLDASYLGSTPLSVSIGPHDHTLTLSMDGYRTESIVVQDLPPEGGILHFGLIEAGIEEELKRKAERHRKWAKGLSYVGLGVLVTSIFFGIQTTSKQQEADLYSSTDPSRADEAQAASDLYNTLLISSLVLAGGIFTFSFIQEVQYFNTYNQISEYDVPIVSTEVAF